MSTRPQPDFLEAIRPLWSNRSGSIAIVFAIALPVLIGVTAGAIDFAVALSQKSRLQSIVDSAALAAASELSLSNARTDNVASVVQTMVDGYFKASYSSSNHPSPLVTTTVSTDPMEVKVTANQKFESYFGNAFGLQSTELGASATARVVGRPNICVLALHASNSGTLSLEQRARVTGNDCAIYSNSTHNIGIQSKSSAILKASTICSAGGVQGGGKNFDPPPYLDCPSFEDPLANRPEPSSDGCANGAPTVVSTSRRLEPGTYCGGLSILSGAKVELAPGTYAIKNGPLVVQGGAAISGKGVGFFLDGANASIDFAANSGVNLEAPTSGPMTGLLIFAARSTTRGNTHRILSENAQVMVGTIYIPTGELRVDGAASIGGDSAYTAIVAETVTLYGGPHIVLNTDYDQTDVPVPEGIKGAGQPVRMVK